MSNFEAIDARYGTMEDFDALVEKIHGKKMRIVIDFVLNHSSNEHSWFNASANRSPGFEDYYVWRDAKYDTRGTRTEPNNWRSFSEAPLGNGITYANSTIWINSFRVNPILI